MSSKTPLSKKKVFCYGLLVVCVLVFIIGVFLWQYGGEPNKSKQIVQAGNTPTIEKEEIPINGMKVFDELGGSLLFSGWTDLSEGTSTAPRTAFLTGTIQANELATLERLKDVPVVILSHVSITEPITKALSRCRHIRGLHLARVTAEGENPLTIVRHMPWLESIMIAPSRPNRKIDLTPLSTLKNLKCLALAADVNLSQLEQIPNPEKLVVLQLKCSILEGSFTSLQRFTSLKMLDLSCGMGEKNRASLDELGSLEQLKQLLLIDTKVTQEEYEKLKSLLPDCEIIYGSLNKNDVRSINPPPSHN